MDNEQLATIISMGFDPSEAQEALNRNNNNVERAIEHLLGGGGSGGAGGGGGEGGQLSSFSSSGGGGGGPTSAPSGNNTLKMIQSETSQYTIPGGRSACTCISLYGADLFLQSISSASSSSSSAVDEDIITSTFLDTMIRQGVEIYNSALTRRGSGSSNTMEHMSVEEVLKFIPLSFQNLVMVGEVRQGILSSANDDHPLGLRAQLVGCRDGDDDDDDNDDDDEGKSGIEANANEWMAVVLTKPPETVVVCLPPSSSSVKHYILLDSHPRPQLGASGSYAMVHDSLEGLVRTLEMVFPAVDLGSDVSEMMAIMYNCFDVYPLQRRV